MNHSLNLFSSVALAAALSLLSSCNSTSGSSTDSENTPKITSGIVGTWLEGSGTSEVTFNADGTGVKETLSKGAVTYTGGFKYEIPSEGSLRITDDKTSAVDLLKYWLLVDGNTLTVADQTSDTTNWTRKGVSLNPSASVSAPVFSPPGGVFSSSQPVTIMTSTPGATIYFTIDGSTPTTSSTMYTGPLSVNASRTLKAIAVKSGMTMSPVASASFTIYAVNVVVPWNTSISYGTLNDARDGKNYRTVKIGTQTWMAEDLAFDTTGAHGSSTSGARGYPWSLAMGIDSLYDSASWTSTAMRGGVCPAGWHLPSLAEWNSLIAFTGGDSAAGPVLKSTAGWYNDGNGLDKWGFRVLSTSQHYGAKDSLLGSSTLYWTSTATSSVNCSWIVGFYSWTSVVDTGYGSRTGGFHVRCIQGAVSQTPVDTAIAPVFSPNGGVYSSAQSVSIGTSTSGASIYYTADGSTPTTSSTKYTSAVTVSATQTLKAIAVKSGMATSSVGSATYTINAGGSTTTTIPWNSSISYGSLTFAGQTYKTVEIGTQTWMAENLNVKVDSSWCYESNADSCAKYGRLYLWAAVMGLDASYNSRRWSGTLPRQGICPSGWHVPSDSEWTILADYIGDTASAGRKLKSASGWEYSGNGTDTYGFRSLPAGHRSYDRAFEYVGILAAFWSSSECDANIAWDRFQDSGEDNQIRDDFSKEEGYSVRCLKDGP